MRPFLRFHIWLANRITWVQYPGLERQPPPEYFLNERPMSGKARAWVWFFVFWGLVCLASLIGNLL